MYFDRLGAYPAFRQAAIDIYNYSLALRASLCGPFLDPVINASTELRKAQNTNPTCAEKARGVTKCVPLKVELKL